MNDLKPGWLKRQADAIAKEPMNYHDLQQHLAAKTAELEAYREALEAFHESRKVDVTMQGAVPSHWNIGSLNRAWVQTDEVLERYGRGEE